MGANRVSYLFIAQDKFTAVANKVSRATDKMRKKFSVLSRVTKKTDKVAGGMKTRALQMGSALAGVLGGGAIIRKGARFQDAMADVGAITGAVGEDLAFFSDESLRLAKSANVAQDTVANAFAVIASAKSELLKNPKGLSNVTEQVLLLKNAAGIGLSEAVQVTTESLNQFSVGADQAARFVNVLAAGSKVGASLVSDTGRAVVESAVFAKQAGLSFEELNAAIQVLAKNGIKGSKAGVALRSNFIVLESTGRKKLMPSIVGLSAALENLSKLNLTTKQSVKLFGREAAGSADILIKSRSLVGQWTKEITGTNVAQEQAAVRMATFNSKARRLGVVIDDKLIKVFQRLEPMLTRQTALLGEWLDSLDDEDIQNFSDSLRGMIEVLKVLAKTALLVGSAFKTMGTFIGETAGAISVVSRKIGLQGALTSAIESVTALPVFGGATGLQLNAPTAHNIPVPVNPGVSTKFLISRGLMPAPAPPPPLTPRAIDVNTRNSKTDVNINLNAPTGVVKSVKVSPTLGANAANVGVNMSTSRGL